MPKHTMAAPLAHDKAGGVCIRGGQRVVAKAVAVCGAAVNGVFRMGGTRRRCGIAQFLHASE